MNKFKITMKPIVKFIRELSVVVTGIAITVGIGFWANNKNNEKDMEEYVSTIKMELEDNAKEFDRYARWLQKSVRYANYLESNDKKNLNQDSLAYYALTKPYHDNDDDFSNDGCGYQNSNSLTYIFTTNAFEMFKVSGAMRQVKDKELLRLIWNTYTRIEGAKWTLDRYFMNKEEESKNESQLFAEGKPVTVPMQFFYSSTAPQRMVDWCEGTSSIIKETLLKLEKVKKVK